MRETAFLTELVKVAAETGAKAAMEQMDKERQKAQKSRANRRLHNTKLLLRNYRMFSEHISNSIFEEVPAESENAIDILDLMCERPNKEELYVESIKRSVTRTRIIMAHVDEMLSIYGTYCNMSARPEEQRRYRVLYAMYIAPAAATIDEIAAEEGIDKRTVYKDIDAAVEKLSALIFGIDGLKRE